MEKVWEFFENLDAYVYASDVETCELVYMNCKARETYGVPSFEAMLGKKCYELVQRSAVPCSFCNRGELELGRFKHWQYYNPIIDKHLDVRSTLVMDGDRRCRVELDEVVAAQQLPTPQDHIQDVEALVNEGLRLALQAPTPDQSLQITLEYVGKALHGTRTCVFERNARGGDDNTYEWVAQGARPERDQLQDLPPDTFATWYRQFEEGRTIIIRDLEEIRESDKPQYEILCRRGIRSLIVVPLYVDQQPIGFYGMENPPSQNLDYAVTMLQIMGHFIVSSMKRRDLVRQLQEMSYHDQLTQLGNRHALTEYLERLRSGEALGLVYCDITGLKRINDSQGHTAGDQLIVSCCECLTRVFGKEGLFRIGGDELLALMPGCTKIELDERIEALRDDMREHELVMAIGAVRLDEGQELRFNELLANAERLMYQDKADYYRRTGIERRR